MFLIGCLEGDIALFNNNVMQQLKDTVTKLRCEIEIIKDTPTLPEIQSKLEAEMKKNAEMTITLKSKEHLIEVSKKHMRKMDHNHKQELEKLKQEIKELRTMSATKDTKTQELENLIESETSRNKTLKEKIYTLEMSNGKLQSKVNTELETMTLQNKLLSDRINTLEMETEELKEEIDTQENDINTLEMETDELK